MSRCRRCSLWGRKEPPSPLPPPSGTPQVQVNLSFYDPKEIDFLGLKALLVNYLDGAIWDCSGLCDAIIAQPSVGTVLKNDTDKDDPLGVLTCLGLAQHSAKPYMQDCLKFLKDKTKQHDKAALAKLEAALKAPDKLGLVVSERLSNCPPQVAPPLMQALVEEMEDARKEDEDPAVKKTFHKMEQVLVLTRVWLDPKPGEATGAAGAGGTGKQAAMGPPPPKKTKKDSSAAGGGTSAAGAVPGQGSIEYGEGGSRGLLVYVRPEDEFLHESAAWSSVFPVESATTELRRVRDGMVPMRLLVCLPVKALPKLVKRVGQAISMPVDTWWQDVPVPV